MQISRDKDLGATGHSCTPTAPVIATQATVFANGIAMARLGDPAEPHTKPSGPFCKFHEAQVNSASQSVFAVRIPVARIADSFDQGSLIQGSPNVIAGR